MDAAAAERECPESESKSDDDTCRARLARRRRRALRAEQICRRRATHAARPRVFTRHARRARQPARGKLISVFPPRPVRPPTLFGGVRVIGGAPEHPVGNVGSALALGGLVLGSRTRAPGAPPWEVTPRSRAHSGMPRPHCQTADRSRRWTVGRLGCLLLLRRPAAASRPLPTRPRSLLVHTLGRFSVDGGATRGPLVRLAAWLMRQSCGQRPPPRAPPARL